jgi:hypothetical protein
VKDVKEIGARIDALYRAQPEEHAQLRARIRRDVTEWRELCDRLFQ